MKEEQVSEEFLKVICPEVMAAKNLERLASTFDTSEI